jgi:hypothetical protein
MKRTKRLSDPTTQPPRTVTETQLTAVKGGATAIEYGLVLPTTPATRSWPATD